MTPDEMWLFALDDAMEKVAFGKPYFVLCGDLNAALILSRLVWWTKPNKQGKTKLRIKREDRLWIAKHRGNWLDECCITDRQFDRAIKILVEKGFVEIRKFKFGRDKTYHFSVNCTQLNKALGKVIEGLGVTQNVTPELHKV